MRTVAHVSTDDLVNSLLQSVTTTGSTDETPQPTNSTSEPLESSASTFATSSSASQSEHLPSSNGSTPSSAIETTPSLTTPSPALASPTTVPSWTPQTVQGTTKNHGGNGVGLWIGITVAVVVLVIASLFFIRSRRDRTLKKRNSTNSPSTGTMSLTVPAHRGFKKERDLGMPEMSIELSPGDLGLSKGFDVSYASSTRTSTASNQFDTSTDSSVFNTRGGLSPSFSSRKMASYSYHYRDSEENGNSNPHLASSTMFHLTGLIGNGQTSGRGGNFNPSRGPRDRKLSAPDEYAELVTATNAHDKMDDMDTTARVDLKQNAASQNEMDISMGPDDNHSFLAPLPTRAAPVLTRPAVARASEESMGPDSPVHGKRTEPVSNIVPNLYEKKMSALLRSSEENSYTMSAASFLTESSISSTSTRDSVATTMGGSAYVSPMPLLQQLSSADDSEYGEDHSSNRASTESSDSTNTARPGSLIALNLEAKGGTSEIAI